MTALLVLLLVLVGLEALYLAGPWSRRRVDRAVEEAIGSRDEAGQAVAFFRGVGVDLTPEQVGLLRLMFADGAPRDVVTTPFRSDARRREQLAMLFAEQVRGRALTHPIVLPEATLTFRRAKQ